jgi:hypothetical protein
LAGLTALETWLAAHNAVIMAVLGLIIGVKLVRQRELGLLDVEAF